MPDDAFTFEFRPAGMGDEELLIRYMRALYACEHLPFREAPTREALRRLLGDENLGRVWIIGDAGTPIGYMVLTFGYSLEFGGRDALLDELFIEASCRHRGAGTAALDFAVRACHELGIPALHLEVERSNTHAQALYRRKHFIDHDRYLMTRWTGAEPPQ